MSSLKSESMWKSKRKVSGKNKYFSIRKKLRSEGKSSESFEIMLNGLTFEDLIGLKLELSLSSVGSGIYNLPLYKNLARITRDATLKAALSVTRNQSEAATLLGISLRKLWSQCKKFQTFEYFQDE